MTGKQLETVAFCFRINMSNLVLADIGIRAIKTFIQGFLGSLVVAIPSSNLFSKDVRKSLLIGAVSSAICALMNLIIELLSY